MDELIAEAEAVDFGGWDFPWLDGRATEDQPPLPFADGTSDLVTSRHPVQTYWDEIARVVAPGGTYFAQQVGPDSGHEFYDFFLGPQPLGTSSREPELARRQAERAGLEVVDLRTAKLRMEFFDVARWSTACAR